MRSLGTDSSPGKMIKYETFPKENRKTMQHNEEKPLNPRPVGGRNVTMSFSLDRYRHHTLWFSPSINFTHCCHLSRGSDISPKRSQSNVMFYQWRSKSLVRSAVTPRF